MSEFFSLKVLNVVKMTSHSVQITLEIPSNLLQSFSFKSGQYITIKHPYKDSEIRRAYSISSSVNEQNITIGIKEVSGGVFSSYANQLLKEGDVLEVMPPQGRFIYEPSSTPEHVAAFSAGSGITPIMSIAKSVLEGNPNNHFYLVYGNKTKEDIMYREELEKMQVSYGDRFHLQHVFSRIKTPDALFGRIDKSIVNKVVKNEYSQVSFSAYYLCGPEEMILVASQTLQEGGVNKERILYELFYAADSQDAPNSIEPGKTSVTVVLDEVKSQFEMDHKTRLLDALLKEKIDAPHSCQGGVCSSCIARVTEGSVVMEKNEILTDSEVEEGLILCCQAHPTSEVLNIDFDDI
jgi:ring-1,2-phenylacetyl-CoA epoxidase subunit PaaE